ncbi:acyltransferase [Caulobacter segnis]|uniref:Acyltransferase 3 domain-containing protein n=1 Tax=Caulobacter segnis TaxID=88688 RepID=A0A2W5V6D7_9CAUL|nr:acyltransferase [Caulobacter segnis]PZR35390.1 MAG: hypothetical protein DI526_07340 [Caulobacter segnis]
MSKLPHLEMLRGVAASLVVADHGLTSLVAAGSLPAEITPYAYLLGMMGVVVFFVISGFLMVRTTASVPGGPATAVDFGARRLLRIVPLYYIATLAQVLTDSLKGAPPTMGEIVKSLLFIPYGPSFDQPMHPIVGQGWTLNYEMFFYALFAVMLLAPRAWSAKILLALLMLLVGVGALMRPLAPYTPPTTALQFWADPVLLYFAFGMMLGMAERRFGPWTGMRWSIPASLALVALAAAIFHFGGVTFPVSLEWQVVFGVLAAIIVVVCIADHTPADGWVARLLVACGSASFSTYLFHTRILNLGLRAWSKLPAVLDHPLLLIIALVVSANAVGYAIYRLVERPVDRLLRRIFWAKLPKRPQPQAA